MTFNSTMKLNSNNKDKKTALNKMSNGWKTHINLPGFYSLPFEGNDNIDYIFLEELPNFIIIPNEDRKIETLIRILNP